MLKRLQINNFALIREMDVSFPGQLTVITGETGAGKSIFLEALALVLGKRADTASLQDRKKKCIIEAVFDASKLDLKQFFEQEGLDEEEQLILRREISAEGKSRSFLNDTPVSLSALKFLSEKLVDIHSQHQTLLLNQANFQLELLDAFAGTLPALREYRQDLQKLLRLRKALEELQEQEAQSRKELDYLNFLFAELSEQNIEAGQLRQMEEESATLENAESIKAALGNVSALISAGEQNLLSGLGQARQLLQGLSKFGERYRQVSERINSLYIELKDISAEIEDTESEIVFHPEKLDELNARMDRLNRLFKKHGVKTEEELLLAKAQIEEKLNGFSSLEAKIAGTQKEIEKLETACAKKAVDISTKRKAAIAGIEDQVQVMLRELSMPNATFKIELKKLIGISAAGIDEVRFLFSANKGTALNDLSRVASGGELSRLMLSLKALFAEKKDLPAIIFDEIDSGVSGDVADKIGSILRRMGGRMQVITITHLPQIASKGSHHLYVYKQDDDERTNSMIRELSKEERTVEIAKMLSTGTPTQSALKNARELLGA